MVSVRTHEIHNEFKKLSKEYLISFHLLDDMYDF